MKPSYWTVPRLWPGETVVILASGPSLSDEDIAVVRDAHCSGRCRAIAVNSTFRRVPFADLLYACDAEWWRVNPDALSFPGTKVSIWSGHGEPPDQINRIRLATDASGKSVRDGISADPAAIHHGKNSGHQTVNVAAHLVGRGGTVALLGFDMMPGPSGELHHHADHPAPLKNPIHKKDKKEGELDAFDRWAAALSTVVQPLADLGIDIVNCSRRTSVTGIRRAPITDILRSP